MDTVKLNAKKRDVFGRKVKKLREEGLLPSNIFGKKIKSQAISVKLDDFTKVYKEVGETGLVSLSVDGKENAVLISNVQVNPVSDIYIHVDFHQVDLKEKVTADIPVEMVGESPAEKQSLGTVVLYIDEVEVEALPTDLPEKYTVDVSTLTEVDQAIYVKDLKIDKTKVEVKAELDSLVAKVEPLEKEEEVVPPPTEEVVEGEEVEGEIKEDEEVKEEKEKQEPVQEKEEKKEEKKA